MNIVLCGFKSCGKTSIGLRVSELLQMPFIDVDDLCENLYRDRMGEARKCREIFLVHGDKYFRDLERDAIAGMEVEGALIATGAGAVLDPRNVEALKRNGIFIYLQLDSEILKERLLTGVLPAYLNSSSPEESFRKMFEERKPVYEKIADMKIDVSLSSITEAAEILSSKVQKLMRPYV